jgi:pyruvate/2-oxoglutarate dehydrogenase complex dihydrolipoamide dehydrogenase (E3) component
MFYNSPKTMSALGIKMMTLTQANNVDYKNKLVNVTDLQSKERISIKYDKLLISTGSIASVPNVISGIDYDGNVVEQVRKMKRVLMCKNYADAQRLVSLNKPDNVCIVGAGHIGMELVWSFQSIGSHVTVIDHGKHILNKYFN